MSAFSLADAPARGFRVGESGLSASTAALIVSAIPTGEWANDDERRALEAALTPELCRPPTLPMAAAPPPDRGDPRPRDATRPTATARRTRVFTDYPALRADAREARVDFVDDEASADVLWLVRHVRSFTEVPAHQRVLQFPYEGGFVRKDLLPLSVRRHCFDPPGARDGAPRWWLECYDLATEFHLFRGACLAGDGGGADGDNESDDADTRGGWWILKPAQGTHAKGHIIVGSLGAAARALAAEQQPPPPPSPVASPDAPPPPPPPPSDRVAQRLVTNPMLVRGRKFDMRAFVVVRAFAPRLDAHLHALIHARLAPKPYDAARPDDAAAALTVCCYDADAAVAARQERLLLPALAAALDEGGAGRACDVERDLLAPTRAMLAELFGGLAPSVGAWPRSRAYYAIDWIFEDEPGDGNGAAPRLIEVNYMGDLAAPRVACEQASDPALYHEFVDDLIDACATEEDLDANPRFTRLVAPE